MNAIVLGGTGSVGRHVIKFLINSPQYNKVFVPVRKTLPEWKSFDIDEKQKMKIIRIKDLNFLCSTNENLLQMFDNEKIDSLFNCLGAASYDIENLILIDQYYACKSAELCQRLNIDHFSIISVANSSSTSNSPFYRTKALAEQDILKMNIKFLDIYKPSRINGRANSGFSEKVFSWICCCFGGVESFELAKAMVVSDIIRKKRFGDGFGPGYKRLLDDEDINFIAVNEKFRS